jgi:hypothetical protein
MNNKRLTPVWGGQIDPPFSGQDFWLSQYRRLIVTYYLSTGSELVK